MFSESSPHSYAGKLIVQLMSHQSVLIFLYDVTEVILIWTNKSLPDGWRV